MIRSSLIINLSMCLDDLLDAYAASRETSKRYRESLLRTVRKAVAAGLTSVDDLQPVQVNRFLVGLSTVVSATTRHNIRRELLTLWRYAFEEGLTEVPPLRVARIRQARTAPQAWSLAELSRMLDCAESDETSIGGKHGMRICDFMPAWVAIAYDTGLRFTDMLSLKKSEIRNGFVVKTANKTGKPLTRPLSAYAIKQVTRLAKRSPDGTVFAWFLTRRRAFLKMRDFYDRHGFDGSGKFLRRSCATYVEQSSPGTAWKYLQHSTPTLVPRHYDDESLRAALSGPPPIK